MTEYTHNEQLFNDLSRAVGGFSNDIHVEALTSDEAKAITDATIVEGDDTDEGNDPIIQAMSNAVNAPMIGSMPIGNALNNAELDEAMTEWMNNRGI